MWCIISIFIVTFAEESHLRSAAHNRFLVISNKKPVISVCSVHIFSHFYMNFRLTFVDWNTHAWQNQLAINSGRTAHNDFTCQVWSCCVVLHTAQCNGHREFQVSSDKWPRLAVDQDARGLSDLSLYQQTLLQPLDLSVGCCTFCLISPHCIPKLSACFPFSSPLTFPNLK